MMAFEEALDDGGWYPGSDSEFSGSDSELEPEDDEVFFNDADIKRDVIDIPTEQEELAKYTRSFLWRLRNKQKQMVVQKRVRGRLRTDAKRLAEELKHVYIPGSAQEENLNTDEICMQEEPNPSVYAAVTKRKPTYEIKVGRSSNPEERSKKKSYEGKELHAIFRYGVAGDASINLLKESSNAIARMRGVSLGDVDIDKLTVKQAAEMEEAGGLPTEARLLLNSYVTKNKKSGGMEELKGVRPALDLNNAEAGIAEYFEKDRDIAIQEGSNPCEHLLSNNMSWVELAKTMDDEARNEFWTATAALVGWEWVGEQQKIVMRSSWQPNLPDPKRGATRKIYDALWNVEDSRAEGLWDDIFGDKMPKVPGEPYNAKKGFDDTDRDEARGEQKSALKDVRDNGGYGIFDVGSEAHRNSGTTIFDSMKELGYPSTPYYEYLHLQAFFLEHKGKKSVVVVHNPLCDIFQSSGDGGKKDGKKKAASKTRGASVMKTQAEKARTANFLQGFIWEIKAPTGKRSLEGNGSYWQNFLTALCMRLFAYHNLHVNVRVASQIGKWVLNYHFGNLLLEENHGMTASMRGTNKRQQRRHETSAKDTLDFQVHYRAMNCISLSTSDDDLDDCIAAAVDQYHNFQEGVAGRSGVRRVQDRNRTIDTFVDGFLCGKGGEKLAKMMRARCEELDKPRKEEATKRNIASSKKMKAKVQAKNKKARRELDSIDSDVGSSGSDPDGDPEVTL